MSKARDRLAPRQGVVLPDTPRDRRERATLDEDLRTIALTGRPLPVRARLGRPSAEMYLAATRGPLPYMLRLREIEQRTAAHEAELDAAWNALAVECAGDERRFRDTWRERARTYDFSEINDLIDRHNRWYPVESRLPMDPRTGDYALVNGKDYRLPLLGADWILESFPAEHAAAAVAAP
jgi:hypothetical protein